MTRRTRRGLALAGIAGLGIAIAWQIRPVLAEDGKASTRIPLSTLQKLYRGADGATDYDETTVIVLKGPGELGRVVDSGDDARRRGYKGPTPLRIAFDADRKVMGVELLPNRETPRYLQRVTRSGLLNRWRGKTAAEAARMRVDTVSGATRSSTAIIDTANRMFTRVAGQSAYAGSGGGEPRLSLAAVRRHFREADAVANLDATTVVALKDGREIGRIVDSGDEAAKGYRGPTPLRIVVDAERTVQSVELLPNRETPSYIAKVKRAPLLKAWNGVKAPQAGTVKVDAVSSATRSSRAVIATAQAMLKTHRRPARLCPRRQGRREEREVVDPF